MQTDTHQSLPELLTVPELAEYLSVPIRTVRFWRENGDGPPAFRVGKRLYFRASDVTRWLDERAASSQSQRLPRLPNQAEEVSGQRRGA
jgi:excisionase family DNA binding protein